MIYSNSSQGLYNESFGTQVNFFLRFSSQENLEEKILKKFSLGIRSTHKAMSGLCLSFTNFHTAVAFIVFVLEVCVNIIFKWVVTNPLLGYNPLYPTLKN